MTFRDARGVCATPGGVPARGANSASAGWGRGNNAPFPAAEAGRPSPPHQGRRGAEGGDGDEGSSDGTSDEGRNWRPHGQPSGWRLPVPSPTLTSRPRGNGGTGSEAQSLAQALVSMQPVTHPPPFEEVYGLVRTTHYARTLKRWVQCHAAQLRGGWGLQVRLILDSGGADGWGRAFVRAHSWNCDTRPQAQAPRWMS